MPTWNEVQEYVRAHYTLNSDYERSFSLLYSYSDGRSQVVICEYSEGRGGGDPWIRLRSPVCEVDALEPQKALAELSPGTLIGALAIIDETYYLIHKTPLNHLDPEEFSQMMSALAGAAEYIGETYDVEDVY